jgi:hypothetical protein
MHKIYTALIVAALGAGIYIGKSMFSKTVEVEKEVVRTDVVTVVKTIERKDGTKETTSTTTDKSVAKKDSTSTVAVVPRSQYHVSVSGSRSLDDSNIVYGLQIEKSFIGPLSLGVRVQTDKQIGLVVGYEF